MLGMLFLISQIFIWVAIQAILRNALLVILNSGHFLEYLLYLVVQFVPGVRPWTSKVLF